ncbi:hypothetical protein SERLA73DRAFT_73833 [Serpula lacrymans var. lacrymans S7.3]|uniref:Uncharacterized protein n=2 Tax=Serpula lacrymans var. lacrymans TaxID=341189 RepID=F8PWW9_SERL3|nr:uncharacterized protein SERLADRAFT_438465 [Serpula lacrymans var. lacrymans S7.9]EGN99296.1 hypothetical protein SERLA73DRAFT_73833 [Serpula lacrymans var. lacrymans S7.3]EGO24863.1 hypothetical protein SERLADRAFT_438465 [Serpula lacrymans var. lacrymans S7.9]
MSQTTPQPPQFPSYLAEPPVITEAQWAHRLALTREQTDIVDATELMSDRRTYFYLFHQSNITCSYTTYPLDTFHCWQQSLLIADELHAVTVLLALLLVEKLTRDNNSALSIGATLLMEHLQIESLEQRLRKNCENGEKEAVESFLQLGGQKVCKDARNILAQRGYLTSPPPDLLSLPALTGHTFPGRHPPHSPPPPPPVSCLLLPDPVLPVPAPPSPAHSSTTNSIAPIAEAVDKLQDILIPMQPTTPLPQLPQPRCNRRLHRQRPEPVLLIPSGRTPRVQHTGQRQTPTLSNGLPPDGRLLRSKEGDTSSSDVALVFDIVMHVKSMAIVPSIVATILVLHADSWGLDDIHNDLDDDTRYNIDGELGDFRAV